jgi:cell division protein FtsL
MLLTDFKTRVLVTTTVLVVLLLATQLVFAVSLATDGQKLSEIGSEIQRLEAENTTLKVKITKMSSLTTLSQRAQTLGFEKPARVITP